MPVERLTEAEAAPAWVRHEHDARYQWAAGLVNGKDVLDVACGTGYGAPLLKAGGAISVRGFDVDQSAIEEARRLHTWAGIEFDVADGTALPIPDQSCDIYLSFETIEHIENDAAYIAEAARVVRPGGWFICSTPNRNVTNPGTRITDKPYNPHHIREYTREELAALLEPHFAVGFIGQTPRQHWWVKLLGTVGRRSPMAAVRMHQARKLAGYPTERIGRHMPTLWPRKGDAEVIIAMCRPR